MGHHFETVVKLSFSYEKNCISMKLCRGKKFQDEKKRLTCPSLIYLPLNKLYPKKTRMLILHPFIVVNYVATDR